MCVFALAQEWMSQHGISSTTALEGYFEQNAYKIAQSVNRTMMSGKRSSTKGTQF